MVAMSRYIAERCSAHIRPPGIQLVLERTAIKNVDSNHDVAAFTQVDQRQRELGIQQRGKRNDNRSCGNSCARSQRPGGVFEPFPGAEHGVEHPIELALPDVGAQPSRPIAAQRNDPSTVTVSQRGLHHLSSTPHDSFGGLGRRTRRLSIHVDQHHHVSGPVGQPPCHVQSATARAYHPVHGT